MSLYRVLEPAPTSASDEANQYHAMNLEQVNREFVDDLIAGGPVGPRVIDLGCGPAGIAIELCSRQDSLQLLAIDSEVSMLEIAKLEIDIAGLLDQITLHHADVGDMEDYDDEMTETVICNSVIHHLSEPSVIFETSVRLLQPGGRLFFRDLVRPVSEREVELLINTHAAGETDEAKQLLRQSLFAALTLEEIQEISGGFGISAEHVQMTSDRHWTIDWCKPA